MKKNFFKLFLIGLTVSTYLFSYGCGFLTNSSSLEGSQPQEEEILPEPPSAVALNEYTTADNVDVFEFSKIESDFEIEKYVLFADGEEIREVAPNTPIEKAEFSEKTLKIRAYYQGGGFDDSREISYVNLRETTAVSFDGGSAVAPQIVTENIPEGGGESAIKLEVLPTLNSVYTSTFQNAAFRLKKGDKISYRICLTDISTNYCEMSGNWEIGKQTKNSVPVERLPYAFSDGLNGFTGVTPSAAVEMQENVWHTVYAVAPEDVTGSLQIGALLASQVGALEHHYGYTAYIDRIRVRAQGDDENYTVDGYIGANGCQMTSSVSRSESDGISIKLTSQTNKNARSGGILKNIAFNGLRSGNYIAYNVKITQAERSSEADGNFEETELSVTELPNPCGFGCAPLYAETLDGTQTTDFVSTNTWYRVFYQIYGEELDADETAFEDLTYNSGKIWLRQRAAYGYLKTTALVDGIEISESLPEKVSPDLETATTLVGLIYPTHYKGFDVNTDAEYVYGNSAASLKLSITASEWATTQMLLQNPSWQVKKGDTVSYYVRLENFETSNKDDRIAWEKATPRSEMGVGGLISPRGLSEGAVTKDHVTDLQGNSAEFIKTGRWYRFSYVAETDNAEGKLQFDCNHKFALGGWDSMLCVRYVLYVDGVTVTKG